MFLILNGLRGAGFSAPETFKLSEIVQAIDLWTYENPVDVTEIILKLDALYLKTWRDKNPTKEK